MNPFQVVLANAEQMVRGALAQLLFAIAALVVFGLFVIAARLARRAVRGTLRRYDPTLGRMLAQLTYGAIVVCGVLTAIWIAIPTIHFREIFAGLGVTGLVLGFALKDLLENFAGGILILWRRPFSLDDQIRSGQHEGTVADINFRSTVLKTYDGVKVYIPNGRMFTEPLENLTGYRQRRTTVVLGIDQRASVATTRDVILDALGGMEDAGVLTDPEPLVLFDAVGDFTNDLHVLYWTSPPTRLSELTTKSAVLERLNTGLGDVGISLPYPIRTIVLEASTADAGVARGSLSSM